MLASLRNRLLLALIAATTLVGLIAFLTIQNLTDTAAERAIQQHAVLTTSAAGHLTAAVRPPLQALVRLRPQRGHSLDQAILNTLLSDQNIEAVQLVSPKGTILLAQPAKNHNQRGQNSSYQQMVKATLQHGGSQWVAQDTARGPRVLISLPHDQGVLIATIRLNDVTRILKQLRQAPGDVSVGIVDESEHLVLHELGTSKPDLAVLAKSADPTLLYQAQSNGFVYARPIAETGWMLVAWLPRSEAFSLRSDLYQGLFLIFAGAMGLAVLLAPLLSRQLLAPLAVFIRHAKRFATGTYDAVNPPFYRELTPLTEAFKQLGQALYTREAELRQSRVKYRDLVQNANSIILHLDAENRITFMNHYAQELFGYDLDEVRGLPVQDTLLAGEQSSTSRRALLSHDKGMPATMQESACLDKHGHQRLVAWTRRPIFDNDDHFAGILAIGTDVTDQRRADRTLQALIRAISSQTGRALIDSITKNICEWLETDLTVAAVIENGQARILSQHSLDPTISCCTYLLKNTPGERVHETGWVYIARSIASLYPDDQMLAHWTIQGYAGISIRDQEDNAFGILYTLSKDSLQLPHRGREIFEILANRIAAELKRERAELDLRASQSHLAHAQRISGLGIWSWQLDQDQVHWSPEVYRAFGLETGSGRATRAFYINSIHPEDRERVEQAITNSIERQDPFNQEYRIIDTHGQIHYLTVAGEVEYDKNSQATRMFGTLMDVTGHRQLQEQLHHSEKMQAVGQLAGGIAHDFNNQLTGMLGYADMLKKRLEDDTLRSFADKIRLSAEHAANLTQQLLAFARRGHFRRTTVTGNAIAAEVLDILKHSIDKRIRLLGDLQAEQDEVTGDPSQLQNAILNLALNARDAMPDGGILEISTWNEDLTDGQLSDSDLRCSPGRYLVVAVRDNGSGIPTEVRKRIFEPFYTTKEPGRGTGMGLAAVYGSITQHGGGIQVDSEVGKGSRFLIYLPVSLEPKQPPGQGSGSRMHLAARATNILVVDDEPMVRNLLRVMLPDFGYQVLLAEDGRQALQLFEQQHQTIDLVVLDMVMPELDGTATFHAMHAINPKVPVIIASGYAMEGEAQALLQAGAQAFIQKPFTGASLSKILAEVLGYATT